MRSTWRVLPRVGVRGSGPGATGAGDTRRAAAPAPFRVGHPTADLGLGDEQVHLVLWRAPGRVSVRCTQTRRGRGPARRPDSRPRPCPWPRRDRPNDVGASVVQEAPSAAPRALARARDDVQAPADGPGALAHRVQAQVPGALQPGVESAAVVPDADHEGVVRGARRPTSRRCGVRVLERVVQRLQDEPVEVLLDVGRDRAARPGRAPDRRPARGRERGGLLPRRATSPSSARAPGRSSKMSARISASAAWVSSRSRSTSRAGGPAGDPGGLEVPLGGAGVQGHREQRLADGVVQLAGEPLPLQQGGVLGRPLRTGARSGRRRRPGRRAPPGRPVVVGELRPAAGRRCSSPNAAPGDERDGHEVLPRDVRPQVRRDGASAGSARASGGSRGAGDPWRRPRRHRAMPRRPGSSSAAAYPSPSTSSRHGAGRGPSAQATIEPATRRGRLRTAATTSRRVVGSGWSTRHRRRRPGERAIRASSRGRPAPGRWRR